MKICIIGNGYWGKIIEKNLYNLGYSEIKIIDKVLNNYHELTDEFDYYFIATPFSTHKSILNDLSNFSEKRIWSEKPLVESLDSAKTIYAQLEENGNMLFVDWTYTFNPCISYLRDELSDKKIKQIVLNRTNSGPIREDTSSIFDLSSHDLSIIYFIFGNDILDFSWNEFSLSKNKNTGSNLSWAYSNGMQIIINSSWEHDAKNRVSFIVTKDNGIIIFDDEKKIIIDEAGRQLDFSRHESPLNSAIKFFFESENFENNKKLTLVITKTLDNARHKYEI